MNEKSILPLDAFSQLESAARALIEAMQLVRGISCPLPENSPLPTDAPLTVIDLVNEFLLAKARAGRSDNYCALLLKHLRAFALERSARSVATVTAAEIESWLYKQPWSDKTRHGHLLTIRTMFTFAVDRNYLQKNPALAVDLPVLESVEKGVHSPAQVRKVLESCTDANTLRFLAVRYFSGLRGSEASALDEPEIREQFILVSALKAKTRQRRLVTITPNLRAWLDVSHERGGRLPLRWKNTRLSEAVKAAAVPWPDNVTRHSFCSYHLAQHGNAGRTAMEAGHTEEMLFRNYRELLTIDGQLITPQLADDYWNIFP